MDDTLMPPYMARPAWWLTHEGIHVPAIQPRNATQQINNCRFQSQWIRTRPEPKNILKKGYLRTEPQEDRIANSFLCVEQRPRQILIFFFLWNQNPKSFIKSKKHPTVCTLPTWYWFWVLTRTWLVPILLVVKKVLTSVVAWVPRF